MNTGSRLALYGAALAVVAIGGWGIGAAVGPVGATAEHGHDTPKGYQLEPSRFAATTLVAGQATSFSFRVLDGDSRPVTRFRDLQLLVVRDDTAGFQRLRPQMAADGTWTTPLTLPTPGGYRAIADFTTDTGQGTAATAIGADSTYRTSTGGAARVSEVDGYVVSLVGTPVVGTASPLTFAVTKDGAPVQVTSRLAVLKADDLTYVRPTPGASGFDVTLPTQATYRLFLDFDHAGATHTAGFTVTASGSTIPNATTHDGGHR